MYYHMQFHQLKYTSSSEKYQPAFDKYRNNRTAMIPRSPPFLLFGYVFWIHDADSLWLEQCLHLFFEPFGKLVIAFFWGWQTGDDMAYYTEEDGRTYYALVGCDAHFNPCGDVKASKWNYRIK